MRTRAKASAAVLICLVAGLIAVAIAWAVWAGPGREAPAAQPRTPMPVATLPVQREIGWMSHPQVRRMSADGRWLYVKGSAAGKDELIEWPTGRRIVVDVGHRQLCTFSPDGKLIAALQGQELRIWKLDKDTEQRTFCRDYNANSLLFAPDSNLIAVVAGYDTPDVPVLQIWDAATANLRASIWGTDLFGHRGRPNVFNVAWGAGDAFLADKHHIVTAKNTSQAEEVCGWDLRRAQVRFRIGNLVNGSWGHPTWRVSPDGERCVAMVMQNAGDDYLIPHPFGYKQELRVPKAPLVQAWDVRTGKLLWQHSVAAERTFFHLSFTPDSKRVAISSRDAAKGFRGEAQIRSMADGAVQTTLALESKGARATFTLSPSGRFLQYHEHPRSVFPDQTADNEGERIVGGWWDVQDTKASPAFTFDGAGSWFDRSGNRHVLFPSEEKDKKPHERRVNLHSNGWEEGIEPPGIEAPGILATLSPKERWLAIRVHRLSPPREIRNIVSTRTVQDSEFELRLIDLHDGSDAGLLHDVEHWNFTPDDKHLVTTGNNLLQVWALPLAAQPPAPEQKEPPPAPQRVDPAPPAVGQRQFSERVTNRRLWTFYVELCKTNVPRQRIAKLLTAFWTDDKEVETVTKMLLKMVKEDEAYAAQPLADPIAELVFRLRDQTCVQAVDENGSEGNCDLFDDEGSPAVRLVTQGFAAIPQLMAAIEDNRFSRAVVIPAGGALDPYVLRVGDCALLVIERIAARKFRDGVYLSVHRKGDPAKTRQVVAAWWQDLQAKGERQMLIDGVLKGDLNSAWQAKALLKKYPTNALSVITQGTKKELYPAERVLMFHLATDRYVGANRKPLPTEVRDHCRAFVDDDFGARPAGTKGDADVIGSLQIHALNVLCQQGDPQATELLLADWERRRRIFNNARSPAKKETKQAMPVNNEICPAMVWCKGGAALPALKRGWMEYPDFIRWSVTHAVHEMLSEPGFVVRDPGHRHNLSELVLAMLSDPIVRDRAAAIPIPGLNNQPAVTSDEPRAERDKVIARLRERWQEYGKAGPDR
jgi:hypothetical protein